ARRGPARGPGLLFPPRSARGVLDVALFLALDLVGPGLVKRPHVPQARFLHDASRCDVDDHRLCEDPLNAELEEALLDQRARAFAGISPPPGRLSQPVAELDLVGGSPRRRSEVEPTDESPARLLDSGPIAVSGKALVVVEVHRENVVLDLAPRRRPTAVDEAHHLRIAVELDEVVHVVLGEPSQHQAFGLEKDVHRAILSYSERTRSRSRFRSPPTTSPYLSSGSPTPIS